MYICVYKFSTIWKSWLTNFQKLPRFLICARDLTSRNRKLSLVEINSARRRCNLPICVLQKIRNLAPVTAISPKRQSLRVATAIVWISVVPPFIQAFARNAIGRSAADASVRSRRSDIRKRMLNSLNKANYNRSTALHIANSCSIWWLINILLVICYHLLFILLISRIILNYKSKRKM